MKIILILAMLFLPVMLLSQTTQSEVFSAGGGISSNSSYTNFGTLGQGFATEVVGTANTNLEGFLHSQDKRAPVAYLSEDNNQSSSVWGYNRFNALSTLLLCTTHNSEIHVSNYSHTGDIDMTGHKYVIDEQDLNLDGNLSGGLITAINTGLLVLIPTQNNTKIYPLTDGTNDLTLSITCLNAPTNPVKVNIHHGKTGDNFIMTDFWDIRGDNNLNATLIFKIEKTALSGEIGVIRFWNGTRYVPIPQDRTTIEDMGTYYNVTITGINQFNYEG
jgi:hypothetical protein